MTADGGLGDDAPGRGFRARRRTVLLVLVLLIVPLTAVVVSLAADDDSSPRQPAGTLPRLRPPPPTPPGPLGKPDVVLVVTDDQRVESLAGMTHVQDLLVSRGTSFDDAMVPTAMCCPSRAALLTGRYSHQTGVWSNSRPTGGWWRFHEEGNEQHTLAVALHDEGYRTALVGKYFNSFANWAPAGYRPPGWDVFTAFTTTNRSGDYYDYSLSDGTVHGSGPADYSTDVLAERAVEFVRTTPASTRLFLYLAPYAPHAHYLPAPRHLGAWKGRLPRFDSPAVGEDVSDKPLWVQGLDPVRPARVRHVQRAQQESLMAVDEAVAQVVDTLQEAGRLENTLFVFTSDNGLAWGEHNVMFKSVPYTPATAVPLVVRWDAQVPAGEVDSRLALNLDIPATIARAASASMLTAGLDLFGERRRDGAVLEAPAEPRLQRPAYCGWRTADWMFTRYATGEEELYSRVLDPFELANVAKAPGNDGRLREMRREARRFCNPVPPGFSW